MIWFRILLVSLNICGYFFQGKSQFLSILGELKLLLNIFSNFPILYHADPCDPSPCGPGTICSTNNGAAAICDCKPGLIPNPDTITGCIDHPCVPTPCGPGTNCFVDRVGSPVCRCEPGLEPKPDPISGCGPK